MNKTEQELLDRINNSHHKVTGVVHGYRTGRKNGSYGGREFNAMISLRDKGIIKIVKTEQYIDCRSRYSDHWSEAVIALAVPEVGVANYCDEVCDRDNLETVNG
jgi:hypothetical protein